MFLSDNQTSPTHLLYFVIGFESVVLVIIDSNQIKNAIRPLALGRKNHLFAGSHDAAGNIAMFYNFFGTCKKYDIDPQKWLKYVMDNIHTTSADTYNKLLPQFIDITLDQ